MDDPSVVAENGDFYGQCYCGGVKFKVAADVEPVQACYCHCESCRRAHAAPLYHVVYVPIESFTVLAGEELIKSYSRTEESVVRSFCLTCGSRLTNLSPRKPPLNIGFFPALLEERVQRDLPEKFKARVHYLSAETVLNLDVIHDGIKRT